MRSDLLRLVLGITALVAVLAGAISVIWPFITPILWALVFASATWPGYKLLRRLLRGQRTLSALLMTVVLLMLVLAPLTGLGFVLVHEIGPELDRLYLWASSEQPRLPEMLQRVPFLKEVADEVFRQIGDPVQRSEWARQALQRTQDVVKIGGNLLRVIAKLFFTVFTLFFVYRDGDSLVAELNLFLDRLIAGRGRALVSSVRETVGAVFFGWLMTALVQGLVAMAGYWIAGVHAPVTLGVCTGFFAVIPFGTAVVWIPVAIALAAGGSWGTMLFVVIWSLGIVSTIDNFLRPFFISGPAKVPFILVFFGVLGGLMTFGLLGLVLGPVFLAVVLALWRQAKESLGETVPPLCS